MPNESTQHRVLSFDYQPGRLVTPIFDPGKWWRMTGSNRRPPACKAGALPAELIPRTDNLVGLVGLEPTTPALSRRCSNHLSYRPLAVTANKPISVNA